MLRDLARQRGPSVSETRVRASPAWPGRGAIGRAEAHSANGHRLVDVSVCRPAPGHFEVAQLTYQVGRQRAERAALGDRIPPATLADAPPEAAPARGDLSWPAHPEPAPAVHAPHRKARCAGRQAFNRLIKPTHREACGYPARTLSCFRFTKGVRITTDSR